MTESSNLEILTGMTERHLVEWGEGIKINARVLPAFNVLRDQAAEEGFDLRPCSGFRSFERQLLIWNGKLNGQRPVLDDSGEPLDMGQLDPWQQVQAVLRWSALPGASRHHWGTDLDVYDAASLPEGYQLQLTHAEAQPGGVLENFYNWLDAALANSDDFYRPYDRDRGGVAVEPWHISYRPVADEYSAQMNPELLRSVIVDADMCLRDTVLEYLDEIYGRYISPHPDINGNL